MCFLQVLKRVGPETVVIHEVSAETAGNLVGQRDFLSVRHSCKQKSCVYLGGAAIQLESFPPQTGFVRYGIVCRADRSEQPNIMNPKSFRDEILSYVSWTARQI